MNHPSPAPLLFFRVLANRRGIPSALMMDRLEGPGAALPDSETLAALSTQFACFYGPGLDPETAAALDSAQWNKLDPATVARVDGALLQSALPPSATWTEGDWCLAAPAKASGAQAASRALALQLVQLVAADADTHEIEALLRRDPTLSYNLLRLVNSLGVGAARRITSFSQAILILGRQQLRRWLNLMLFAAREGDLRSSMLLARVAVRARALELLAKACGLDKNSQEQAFMAGMFSLLGVLFGMPLDEVLAPLALGEAVQGALLRREGELGVLLEVLEHAERGEFGAVAERLAALQVPANQFNQAMADASLWMLGALRESQGQSNG